MDVVGIDLGTTNSLVAVLGAEGPTALPNELGDHLTPSVIAIAADGSTIVGRSARDRLVVAPDAGRAFFKRDMGTDTKYEFGGRTWTPTECSATILREMRRVAEVNLGHDVKRAVVTVPAYFHDPQRQATLKAAEIAGLKVERILNEPTAAALAYGYQAGNDEERRLLVFDLGGGTFDVTVLEVFEGIVEVRASAGDSRLGGEDYTDALVELLGARVGASYDPVVRARLRQAVEVAKRALWQQDTVEFTWEEKSVPLTRADVANACAALNARLMPILQRCVRDARLTKDEIDDVLFVGGASRLQTVVDLVTDIFGRLPNRSLDPDRVVSYGAAVQAARVERHAAVEDLVMTDVCPHSLGIQVAKEFGGRYESGHFMPILDRNVTVPVSRVEPFQTLHPQQDELKVEVFQGEHRHTEKNTLLGEMLIKGLRSKPKQRFPGEVSVRFTYDANGILEIEVTILETGKVLRHVIESRPGAMAPEEVARAVASMAPLKVSPRDLLPNRARLERANRHFAELTGMRRQQLGEAIDRFEAALAAGHPDEIGFAAMVLDDWLGDRYHLEDETPQETSTPDPQDQPES
ncbi:MAG: Hsp70 family protein [Planctomycetota bacterium]|nr:Hsp70 family protein [Planctomycetota bacterium]